MAPPKHKIRTMYDRTISSPTHLTEPNRIEPSSSHVIFYTHLISSHLISQTQETNSSHRRLRLSSLATCLFSSPSNLPNSAWTTFWQDRKSIAAPSTSAALSPSASPPSPPPALYRDKPAETGTSTDDRRRRGRRRLLPLYNSFGNGGGASSPNPLSAGRELLQ